MTGSLQLSELTECPFCGNDEFMLIGKPKGEVRYRQKFNGTASRHNSAMYDRIQVDYTKICCSRCGKYLGNLQTGECNTRVKEALGIRKMM